MHPRICSAQNRNGINGKRKMLLLPWMDLYGFLGQPVLRFPFVNISSLINNVILFGRNKVVLFEKPTSLNTFMVMLPITPYSTAFSQSLCNIECNEESFQLERDLMTLITVCLTNFQCFAEEGSSSLWLLTSWFAKREILLSEQNVYSQKSLVWLFYSACLRATRDCFRKAAFCTHLLGPWCSCPSVVFVKAWTKSRWVCWSSDPLSLVQQSPGHQIECWEHAL